MSNIYWSDREKEKLELIDIILDEQLERGNKLLSKVVENINTEVSKLYSKYAKDNGLSYREAILYLTNNESKEFKKDLNEYITICKDTDKLDKYRQELQAISTRARVKRLDVVKANIYKSATELEHLLKSSNVESLKDIYLESYIYSNYSIEGARGTEVSFTIPGDKKIKKLLEHPWSGKNYSEKVWDITDEFIKKMDSIVTVGLIQGKSYKTIAKELEGAKIGPKGNGGQKYKIERLVITEAAFISEQATKDSYNDNNLEEYEYLATLDIKTSETCQSLDDKKFKVKDAVTGVNYPPMHAFCRSTTVPIVKWEGEDDDIDTRIYRDPVTGKNEYSKISDYSEWKEKMYNRYGENRVDSEQKKIRNQTSDKLQFDKYKATIKGVKVPRTFNEFQDIKYNNSDEWNKLKLAYKTYNSKKNIK